MERTYKIVRFKFNDDNEVIKEGLTLEEAQEWCNREDTHDVETNGKEWFDGYAEEPFDFDSRYKVEGWGGVAWRAFGYETESREIVTDDGDEEVLYFEYEDVENKDHVKCHMVGDDREHIFDVADLTKLDDHEYCSVCGQIGCNHNY